MYLYRAIDSGGDTVEFFFSEHRDLVAVKRFLRKVFQRHGRPEPIVIDARQTDREAIIACEGESQLRDRSRRPKLIRIRRSRYPQRPARAGSLAHQAPHPIHARLHVAGERRCHPIRHRVDPHDAQTTGEIGLQSKIVGRGTARNPLA